MKRLRLSLAVVLCVAGLRAQYRRLRPEQDQVARIEGRRVALVIGNGAYRSAPLRNPVHDAQAMAAALQACGFQVVEVENAGRARMFEALREFRNRASQAAAALFFYAGHGLQVKGRNYLVPVDADIQSEEEASAQALEAQSVLDQMEASRARVKLVILDACRNNPFASASRGGSRGLAQMDAPKGSFIAYATAPGMTAADGSGQNGLFTENLLQALRQPGLTVEEVFKRVRVGVSARSHDQQIPWDSSSLTGDFYFREAGGPHRDLAAQPVGSPEPAPMPAYLEGEEAQRALVKTGFETQAEYEARLAKLPLVVVGKVRLQPEKYDLVHHSLPVRVVPEPWAKGLLQKAARGGTLDLDRSSAKTLCDRSLEQPLAVQIQVTQGEPRPMHLSVLTDEGLKSLGPELPPVPGATQNVFGRWEVQVQVGKTAFVLVQIPGGTFAMGSPTSEVGRNSDEGPQHPVTITRDFWLGKFDVTQGQWQAIMGSNPSHFTDGMFTHNSGPDAPVEKMDWEDCQRFIRKLNGMQSQWVFRLPTEAEWEYACRAGTVGERYGDLEAIAWHEGNSGKTTHPVGLKQPNAFGLYDMLGNVWQWCQDWYGESYYQVSPASDPSGPGEGPNRVLRGGSWRDGPSYARAASRRGYTPDLGYNDEGCRLACMPAKTP